MEKNQVAQSALLFSLAEAPATDLRMLNTIVATISQNSIQFHQLISTRAPAIAERNLYACEPRCMGW
jgi:hypothetical protein